VWLPEVLDVLQADSKKKADSDKPAKPIAASAAASANNGNKDVAPNSDKSPNNNNNIPVPAATGNPESQPSPNEASPLATGDKNGSEQNETEDEDEPEVVLNAEGNKITFFLVGTKSDKVFENGIHFSEEVKGVSDSDAFNKKASSMQLIEDDSIHTQQEEEELNDISVIAKMYANRKGFANFYETSSLFSSNVKTVFDEAVEVTYQQRKEKIKGQEGRQRGSSLAQG